MKSYTEEEFLFLVKTASKNMQTFYQQAIVNYRGRIKGTKIFYTEYISEFLLNNFELLEEITSITRKKSYKIEDHKGEIKNRFSGRDEEIMAKVIFTQKKVGVLGEILDYQVPLKDIQDNKNTGKIDLLSYNKNTETVYLLELKKPTSQETMLRSILEAYTYKRIVNQDKLLSDYGLPNLTKIVACPLVFSTGYQKREYQNEHPYLLKLIQKIDSHPVFYDKRIIEEYFV